MATKPLRNNDTKTLTPVEACLLRPFMYVGSVNEELIDQYVYVNGKLELKSIPTIPALIKIFDEIISNSLDEAIRTKFKYANKIKVCFNEVTGVVSVEDNGRGLPIELDKKTGKWTPEEIFTSLHSGSNFNDDDPEKGLVVGQNGVGSSLTNIYSKRFVIESANGHKSYKQNFDDHLSKIGKPIVGNSSKNFTTITYLPDYDYFKVSDAVKENLTVLYEKRVRDLAFAYPEIVFHYKDQKIFTPNLKTFVRDIHPVSESNEVPDARVALFYSETEFAQMSFCNGANTYNGGTHVDYAMGKIIDYIREYLKKKHKLDVKPIDIKSKIFLLLSIRMQNPQFESQVKTKLMSSNGFKALVDEVLSEKFLKSILKNDEIILPIVEAYNLKLQVKENLELKKIGKAPKKVRVDKYYPAIKQKKYLVLTEGDSAQNGLMSILGRDIFSYFPLKGKPLNVLEAKFDKIKENDEIKNIVTILGMRLDKDIQTDLLYQNILIGTDQDLDGLDIRGLVLAFFYRFGKSLLIAGRIKYIRTPLLAGFDKNGKIKDFYFTLSDYHKGKNPNYKYTYYKGLSTWESEHLSEVIALKGIDYFIQDYEFDAEAEQAILNWMKKENVGYRKEQLRDIEFDINTL